MEFVIASRNVDDEKRADLKLKHARTDHPIVFVALVDIYIKFMGKPRLAFQKGERYEGIVHSSGAISAYSHGTGGAYVLRKGHIFIERAGWL